VGTGLRAGPSIATCSTAAPDSCPSHYNCMQPLFGMSYICCSNKGESFWGSEVVGFFSNFVDFLCLKVYSRLSEGSPKE
jgi:hypothetical protein